MSRQQVIDDEKEATKRELARQAKREATRSAREVTRQERERAITAATGAAYRADYMARHEESPVVAKRTFWAHYWRQFLDFMSK